MKKVPQIILICDGGVIQQIISNTEVKVVNLDHDIFECDMEEPEYYYDRFIPVDVYNKKDFATTEAEIIQEWDDKMEKHPSFNK